VDQSHNGRYDGLVAIPPGWNPAPHQLLPVGSEGNGFSFRPTQIHTNPHGARVRVVGGIAGSETEEQ
jgi:hypothetical protein